MRLHVPVTLFVATLAICFAMIRPVEANECLQIKTLPVENVDMTKVREAWFGWVNDLRGQLKLPAYVGDEYLDTTAANWSAFSVARGMIDHKRIAGAPYYDYRGIEKWFGKKGLTFANLQSKTFTENIGWGPFKCTSDDCTDSLIRSIRSTFDFFLSEKAAMGSHYRSMINPQFTLMGVGVALSPKQGRYYLTIHYATEITSNPAPLCSAQA